MRVSTELLHNDTLSGRDPGGAAIPAAETPVRQSVVPRLQTVLAWVLFVSLWTAATAASAGVDGVVFPFATYTQRPHLPAGNGLKEHESHVGADLFALASYGDWRFLGEFMLSDQEHDLERLIFGRRVGNNTLLWLGRYHTPAAYWDILYHHAPFLQTSITRPQMVQWEDDGGVIPIHLWGLRADETVTQGRGEWQLHFGLGAAPKLAPGKLEAVDALNPRAPGGRLMGVMALSYLPDALGTNEIGVFADAARLPSDRSDVSNVDQALAGGFANWTVGPVHAIGSLFGVHNRINRPTGAKQAHTFYSGYLQLDLKLGGGWTPYARYEGSVNGNDDPYVKLLSPGLANTILVGGLRYEFTSRQAVTLEAVRAEYPHDHYSQFMFQWSGMFP